MRRRGTVHRVGITLACMDCKSRNYRTTKKLEQPPVEQRKFCKACGRHTLHQETK